LAAHGTSKSFPKTGVPFQHFVRLRGLRERWVGADARMQFAGGGHVDERAHAGAARVLNISPFLASKVQRDI